MQVRKWNSRGKHLSRRRLCGRDQDERTQTRDSRDNRQDHLDHHLRRGTLSGEGLKEDERPLRSGLKCGAFNGVDRVEDAKTIHHAYRLEFSVLSRNSGGGGRERAQK